MAAKIMSFIMSGGIGSRLWPLSREDFPKQFHNFSGQGSMLMQTLTRILNFNASPIFLIASENHETRISRELSEFNLNGGRPIFEPIGRNTAAVVALASQICLTEGYADDLVLIVPSDHQIEDEHAFWQTINLGVKSALKGNIVVFGVRPTAPETGYGYIEVGRQKENVYQVKHFIEKPNLETAKYYFAKDNFFWNSGIFLFSPRTMQICFDNYSPQIWQHVSNALKNSRTNIMGTWFNYDDYANIPANSIDYAIMEKAKNISLVKAQFQWSDLGSWQSLLDVSHHNKSSDNEGNVIVGDVVAMNCQNSYLRSDGGLLAAVGLNNMAVVATNDATFVAPIHLSQNVRDIVSKLEKSGRLEVKFTPAPDLLLVAGSYKERVRHWLFEEALPLWSTCGIDDEGGFYEFIRFDQMPLNTTRRMRTMARQIYAFAIAGQMGWQGPFQQIIDHGLDFILNKGRSVKGGFVSTFDQAGNVLDATEDLYDQAFVLLALAHAHKIGCKRAFHVAKEVFEFLSKFLKDKKYHGYFETIDGTRQWRRSNPHMHLLESYLAWYEVTEDLVYLQQAQQIVTLFINHFFNSDCWTLGEYFNENWQLASGPDGQICEPGHHFEWASLLVNFEHHAKKQSIIVPNLTGYARKLYAFAVANGVNRATGLAYNTVSREGVPIDFNSRSWPQTEVIKAAIALDENQGPNLKPEIETRIGRLFRWHIDAAPKGLWIDNIDQEGRALSKNVPASIFYHIVSALTQYLDFAKGLKSSCNR